jgi:hypothetical protein
MRAYHLIRSMEQLSVKMEDAAKATASLRQCLTWVKTLRRKAHYDRCILRAQSYHHRHAVKRHRRCHE